MCKLLGINKTRTTPLHPQSDGMVERFNQTLIEHLAKVVDENQRDWDRHIPLFHMAYRSAIHTTTGETPSKVLFGTTLRTPADMKYGVPPEPHQLLTEYVENLRQRLYHIHRYVRLKIKRKQWRFRCRRVSMAVQPTAKERTLSKAPARVGRTLSSYHPLE